jgi:hypothetical protein
MNREDLVIDIEWDGPYRFWDHPRQLEPISDLTGPTDYGVYQIYGGHPVYGNSALLYIGLAAVQYFGVRIPQEKHWLDNRDAGRVEVYVGRLSGTRTPDSDIWDRYIRLAERLLIHAHAPPMNVQKSLANLASELRHVHVLNWGYHRDLLPEVSGLRWASLDEDFSNDYAEFTDEDLE